MKNETVNRPAREAADTKRIVMRGWNWQYARWLVMLRKALLATGCFEGGVYPDPRVWWDYYKYTNLTPYQAAKKDKGVAPSYFYMEWNGRYPKN